MHSATLFFMFFLLDFTYFKLYNLEYVYFKGGVFMERIANELMNELNCDVAFTIPIFGGIDVLESVVITWIIMAVLVLLSIIFVRNLKLVPTSKVQVALEAAVGFCRDFFRDILGKEGDRYIPFLSTVMIYIGCANLIGLFSLKPPTKDINVTLALSLISIILIEGCGLAKKGPRRFLKSFAEPIAVVAPINVLELVIKPLSLCMRLFGNVLGAFVIMELIKLVVPIAVPVVFSLYFDIFDGIIQTYVFVFLTSLFMKENLE